MDAGLTGALIAQMRHERGLTQRQLGEMIGVGDRAVSKWERGAGCPDISLIGPIAGALGITTDDLIAGQRTSNAPEVGNMRHLKFYRCPTCGNILTATGSAQLACCGKPLEALVSSREPDDAHRAQVENIDGEYHVHLDHPMDKDHFIVFIAYVTSDRLQLVRMYPEQEAETRLRISGHGTLFVCCTRHGLFETRL